ncbi:MAG: GDP-mannose 4,6-dehydratase [Patescibacteria group bacterium]
MKKALITGIGGFVGSHLTSLLIKENIQVHGIKHPSHPAAQIESTVKITNCDTQDKKTLEKVLREGYDYIFHLAAFSSPSISFASPKETIENNLFGQLNLLQILSSLNSKSKILIVGSADEYGDVEKKYLPVSEEAPLAPQSPYAVSKVAQDMLGLQFFLHGGLNVVRVRPFNHIGPGQSRKFVVPAFASQIAALEKKGSGEIKVGNINTYRDFTDVRDIVKAYLLALDKGVMGEVYNIGSGRAYKIADILEKLISFSTAKIKIVKDKKLLRQADIKKIYCDYSKFKKQTGWVPKISIDKTLFDTIKFERARLK